MLSLEEAQNRILTTVRPLGVENTPLKQANRRMLAEDVRSTVDVPAFDNSAMDGYAVVAADLAKASAESPIVLKQVGAVAAGGQCEGSVSPGNCIRLFTGSPLPAGADAVVMQEDTRIDAKEPSKIWFLDTIKPWENVRLCGEDVKCGEKILAQGKRLDAAAIGLLAALGITEVKTARAPVVGLLATGNELREAGQPLEPGQIYESNRACLAILAEQAGARVRSYPLVPDTLADTCQAMELAIKECDVVVSSGGVSVGGFDFVKEAFKQIGGQLDFWRVAIKPGKPFVSGHWHEKLFFGLPGNPVSAFVTFLLFARPALLAMQGATETGMPISHGTLANALSNRGDRRHFLRVRLDAQGKVHSAGAQASHMLSSLAEANGLLDVPPETTLSAGTAVQILRWD